MKTVRLSYLNTVPEDRKIVAIYRNTPLLEDFERRAQGGRPLPDSVNYYPTPLVFPKPGADRPYLISSIVLSADGKMAFQDNPVGPLIAKCNALDPDGGACDFWCLNLLRAYADGLLIGANTLNRESAYINHCMDRELMAQRKEVLQKPDQPCQVVVSLDGTDIPFSHDTFSVDPAERLKVMIATSPEGGAFVQSHSPHVPRLLGPFTTKEEILKADLPDLHGGFSEIPVLMTGVGAEPDMQLMLYALRQMGMELVSAESPTYCSALLDAGYLDEYFVTYSMVYAGGTISPGAAFPKSWKSHPHSQLVSVGMHRQNFLFTRQCIQYGAVVPDIDS